MYPITITSSGTTCGTVVQTPVYQTYWMNDNLDPVDESGALVLPGLRTCGHRDCVNPKHVAS